MGSVQSRSLQEEITGSKNETGESLIETKVQGKVKGKQQGMVNTPGQVEEAASQLGLKGQEEGAVP